MEKIIVYQKCCSYGTTKKLMKEGIVPLAVKVDTIEEKENLLRTHYFLELKTSLEGIEIFHGNYLIYDYQRNENLKNKNLKPEISMILYKNSEKSKGCYNDVKFDKKEPCEVMVTNVGKYNLKNNSEKIVRAHIENRLNPNRFRPEINLFEISCDYKEAKKFISKGIYPLYINEPVKKVEGPYLKAINGWKLNCEEQIFYDHLIKLDKGVPTFYKIEERSKEIVIYDNGTVYDIDIAIDMLGYKPSI